VLARLQAPRPEPPEFCPDPALHLDRALCYTGGLPTTLAFVGPGDEYMAFPCNNVIVLAETPLMPEVQFSEQHGGGGGAGAGAEGFGVGGEEDESDVEGGDGVRLPPRSPPPPHIFLRGHTDTITRLQLSHAGHLLASAQGDSLGAAGELSYLMSVKRQVGRSARHGKESVSAVAEYWQ